MTKRPDSPEGTFNRMFKGTFKAPVDRYPPDLFSQVVAAVIAERIRNLHRWGLQDHPSVAATSRPGDSTCILHGIPTEAEARSRCERLMQAGKVTWADILLEEVAEAVGAADDTARRDELVQVAAVALAWIECIDRRSARRAAQHAGADGGRLP